MKVRYDYLKDTDFLKYVAGLHIKQFYVKMTSLSWQEDPIKDIEGRVINASFNIDGNSSVRRTGNLSLITDGDNHITDIKHLFSLNKKIYVQIGYLNNTPYYTKYKILWFPIGLFVIGNASVANADTGLTISLQLKDKMSLLNGECGGIIPASCQLDTMDTVDQNGDQVTSRPSIYQIIQELVNHWGGQQLGKIIISDLDTRVKQAVKWNGDTNMYLYEKPDADWSERYRISVDSTPPQGYIPSKDCSQFEPGQSIGYIYTDFTFPGDLIAEAGNSVVDVLEKIKAVLGNYEYFYDLDGNFIWQEIKNFFNNSEARYIDDAFNNRMLVPDYISKTYTETQAAYLLDASKGKTIFDFTDSNLVKSYNNAPQYSSIKNDYVVWGIRKVDNLQIPIRYHLAIDEKPKTGNTYKAFKYLDPKDGLQKWHVPVPFKTVNDFPQQGKDGVFYRDESEDKIYKWGYIEYKDSNSGKIEITYQYIMLDVKLQQVTTSDWRTELYFQGVQAQPFGSASNYYYAELVNEWPKIYDIENGELKEQFVRDPSLLDYYLDFIEPSSKLIDLNVNNIGRRSAVINAGNAVNCIFEPWIPDVVYIGQEDVLRTDMYLTTEKQKTECEQRGQNYCLISQGMYDCIEVGGQLYSAYEQIRQQLHQYTQYNESITVQTLPMYHLEPNTRISVQDIDSDIYGDYMINTMSFALDNEGLLTINASRALERV